jgi:hypothetical protein
MSGKIKHNKNLKHSKPKKSGKSGKKTNKRYYYTNIKRGQGKWTRPDVPTELHGIKCEEVVYKIPNRKGRKSKRSTFNRETSPAFLKRLAQEFVTELKDINITDEQIKQMKEGVCPNGYNVHHILPLHGGGQNKFENLCLMPIKEHDELHDKIIDPQIKGMDGTDRRTIWLPVPKTPVFIPPHKAKQAENIALKIAEQKQR